MTVDFVRTRKGVTLVVGGEKVTRDNVEVYATENERKLKILSDEIERRGYLPLHGEYTVREPTGPSDTLVAACSSTSEAFGPLSLVQDGRKIEFRDASGKWSGYGVVVERYFAVVPGARDQVSPRMLTGVVSGGAMLLLLSDNSATAFDPSAKSTICRVGILSKK